MNLVRRGAVGEQRPGMADAAGAVLYLSAHLRDFGFDDLSPRGLQKLAKIEHAWLPVAAREVGLGAPFAGTRQFIAVGLNFSDPAAEAKMAIPAEPA